MKRLTFSKRDLVTWAGLTVAIFSALLTIFLVARFSSRTQTSVQLGTETFRVTVAKTDIERERGLSNTPALPAGTGMLLVFSRDDRWSIWMKDMHYPIDVIWLASDKDVVAIEKGMQPTSFPNSYAPKDAARYVLELPAGSAERAGITVDKTAVFSDNNT